MAEEQFQGSGNWWETTPARNLRFESVEEPQSSSFDGWQQQQQHHGTMSTASGSSSMVFQDTRKLQTHDCASTSSNNPNLHMMGLELSSATIDWNQASLLRSEKASEGSFRSMLQDNLSTSSNNFQEVNNRGFSLEQTQFSPQYSSGESNLTSQSLPCSTFQIDSSSNLYGNPSMLQGILGQENNHIQNLQHGNSFENRPMNFPYSTSYGLSSNELMSSWSSKVPQFLRASPPKQQPQHSNNQLHFTNNAPFWNASEATITIKDSPSSFFPSLQPPFATTNFDAQTKNISEGRDSSGVGKKSRSEPAPKRARNETPSSMPAFKVRKEKMGDRITALQQLVSPFGKTDTASVLSEAIEYIKFLHEQVTVLSTPYMKSGGAPVQHQQSSSKSKEVEGPKQDLRSRGLCLVPVSSTFPMTHEPTVEYWTPTFGGTYR